MFELINIARKNLWRNKRRTLITIASIYFALSSVLFMKGMNLGIYEKAIDGIVRVFTGYAQITAKGYWEDQTIENTFDTSSFDYKILRSNKNIANYADRLQSFALASHGTQTKGLMVIGTELDKENQLTSLKEKLVKGKFFSKGKNEVVLTKGLASYLKIDVGDTLVLIGQGYHGISAAGKFEVKGIVHFKSYPDLDKQTVYMDLSTCQEFYSAHGLVSSIAINLKDPNMLDETKKSLEKALPTGTFTVITWETMFCDLKAMMESDMRNTNFLTTLLYLIAAFGIFGTLLMMTVERRREFGVLIAIGMHKRQLCFILILEMIFIALLSLLAIIPFTLPMMYYLNIHPLEVTGPKAEQLIGAGFEPCMPVAWQSNYIIQQMIIVFCIVCIASIYPIYRAIKIKNIPDALKN